MEKKKNEKANLEKAKTLFLSIGLIFAIAVVASAFKWQSDTVSEIYTNNEGDIPEEISVRVTKPEPEKPKPEKKQQTIKSFITDLVNITTDTSNVEGPDIDWTWEPPVEEDSIEVDPVPLIFAQKMPQPYGGINSLRRFIAKNVNYPAVARENGIQGTVYLRFEVTKTGTIGKVELQKGVDPLLDDEAIKVVKKLPKFKPGMNNGVRVNVWLSVPISFKLN